MARNVHAKLHAAAYHTVSAQNVNVMLEFIIMLNAHGILLREHTVIILLSGANLLYCIQMHFHYVVDIKMTRQNEKVNI